MEKLIICSDCGYLLEAENIKCPQCGSELSIIVYRVTENLTLAGTFGGKVLTEGKKKPAREFMYGADYSEKEHRYMQKERVIDRENNIYHEKVTDPKSGDVIHECDEPLTSHFGHGSAKEKENKSECQRLYYVNKE